MTEFQNSKFHLLSCWLRLFLWIFSDIFSLFIANWRAFTAQNLHNNNEEDFVDALKLFFVFDIFSSQLWPVLLEVSLPTFFLDLESIYHSFQMEQWQGDYGLEHSGNRKKWNFWDFLNISRLYNRCWCKHIINESSCFVASYQAFLPAL